MMIWGGLREPVGNNGGHAGLENGEELGDWLVWEKEVD